ncbi:MAG TPA: hypothetical protein VG754_03985 [Verrucomicrobiae bacterium]|jgi:hypothetical protein|nr:hypothetical protein [Verrucomicrobiae bacterium]
MGQTCEGATVTDPDAYLLRENTGTTGLELTARAAAAALAQHHIPHLIVGGFAVQEHGYPRLTIDLDIIVPDVLETAEFLTADLSGPFARVPGQQDRVKDKRNGVFIDLLPAGHVAKQGCKVPFPLPEKASDKPQIVTLENLISLKLDSWSNSPLRRLRDKSDAIELITRRKLPRDLGVAEAVRSHYLEIWDGLQAER